MTTLAITPNWKSKTAKFKGTIAAGEYVDVSIVNMGEDGNEFITDTTNLRLRVVDEFGRTLAQFPLPEEPDAASETDEGSAGEGANDGEEGEATEGESEGWDSDTSPLRCTLNLNTVQMLRAVPPHANVPLWFVLDAYKGATDEDEGEFTLYFKDRCEVTHWPRRRGEEEPTDLGRYKDIIAEFGERLTTAEQTVTEAAQNAQNAANSAQEAERSASAANTGAWSAASAAQTSAGAANEAKSGAIAAQGLAETAKTAAETAQTKAEVAQTAAEAAASSAASVVEEAVGEEEDRAKDAEADLQDAITAEAATRAAADTALSTVLAGSFKGVSYDEENQNLVFTKNDNTTDTLSAKPFIKDGMVSDVYIGTGADAGYLVITFNTDATTAGKQTIKILLTDIFNPSNYYDKAAVDRLLAYKEDGAPAGYSYFLSASGDDQNDGLTPLTAKRTIDGCYAAFPDGAEVCVMAGQYAAPLQIGVVDGGRTYYFINPGKSLSFTAVDGPDQTSIVGTFEGDGLFNNGYGHTLAFWDGAHTFRGFTIRGLAAWFSGSGDGGAAAKTTPMMSNVRLEGCRVVGTGTPTPAPSRWGLLNGCTFTDTVFADLSVDNRSLTAASANSNSAIFALDSSFNGCRVHFALFAAPSGATLALGRPNNTPTATDTLFVVDTVAGRFYNALVYSTRCTYVWNPYGELVTDATSQIVRISGCTDCYFVAQDGLDASGGTRNAAAALNAQPYLDADYVPDSVECNAVRADGTRDVGWKDSGLGAQKTAANLAASIAEPFSTSKAYDVGDVVMYNGSRYHCTQEHAAGAFSPLHFEKETVEDALASKADAADLRYALVTASPTGDGSYVLADRAATAIPEGVSSVRLVFPPAVEGRARNFKVLIPGSPRVEFAGPGTVVGRSGSATPQFVEYVEATGTQWIDTGVVGRVGTRVTAKFMHNAGMTSFPVLVGAFRSNIGRFNLVGFYGQALDMQYANKYGFAIDEWGYVPYGGTYSVDSSITAAGVWNAASYAADGSVIRSKTVDVSSYGLVNTGLTMGVFADNTDYGPLDFSRDRLYGLKIWQDGILVRDFRPCAVDGDGALYDAVSGSVFKSKTDPLSAGPAVSGESTLYSFTEVRSGVLLCREDHFEEVQ